MNRPGPQVGLDELCRLAAQEMLAVALEAERQAYLERYAAAVDEEGRRLVVGNGHAREREITPAAGRIAVQAPRIDDRRDGERYISALLPPYMRRQEPPPKTVAIASLSPWWASEVTSSTPECPRATSPRRNASQSPRPCSCRRQCQHLALAVGVDGGGDHDANLGDAALLEAGPGRLQALDLRVPPLVRGGRDEAVP